MTAYKIHIRSYGSHALLLEWPEKVEIGILDDMLRLRSVLQKAGYTAPEWDMIPAYRSLALVSNKDAITFENIKNHIQDLYQTDGRDIKVKRHLWHLPVCYDESFGIDLGETTDFLGLAPEELVAQHTAQPYTVYGIGFVPGFMYLGGLPSSLETQRRKEPRLLVKKGSVGLAGKQTGIYPQDSPGGWNIIGNCPIPIFSLLVDPPCFVSVGDKIQFYPISLAEHELRKIEADVGVYNLKKEVLSDHSS